MKPRNTPLKNLLLAAMFLAIGLVLPFFTGQIKEIGNMLLPMHLPVFLCALICGWQYGTAVGFIMPILRFALFFMPRMPGALAMAFEMGTYGALAGLMYRKLPRRPLNVYVSLLIAMVAGRIAWGLVRFVLAGLQSSTFTLSAFLAGAVTSAIPGIVVQIVLIPVLVMVMEKAKLTLND